jgi:hypothetical protein
MAEREGFELPTSSYFLQLTETTSSQTRTTGQNGRSLARLWHAGAISGVSFRLAQEAPVFV